MERRTGQGSNGSTPIGHPPGACRLKQAADPIRIHGDNDADEIIDDVADEAALQPIAQPRIEGVRPIFMKGERFVSRISKIEDDLDGFENNENQDQQ
jgi:hypothetical protein